MLAFGTGALNIDGCRVGAEATERVRTPGDYGLVNDDGWSPTPGVNGSPAGRFPANLVLSHLPECREVGDREIPGDPREGGDGTRPGGFGDVGAASGNGRPAGALHGPEVVPVYECAPNCPVRLLDEQAGELPGSGPSRFFYTGKASTSERDGSTHPTVKPRDLMRWLVCLVTPRGGLVLDPFGGSGTTALAARDESLQAVLIERDEEYAAQAAHRLRQLSLLGGGA